MSARFLRRDFLGLLATLPAAAVLRWTPAWGASTRARMVFVHEAALPRSVWLPMALRHAAVSPRALEGDRVRFARAILADAPLLIGGLTRHADLIVLAGTAEEAGFRLVEQSTLAQPASQPALIFWRMQHRRVREGVFGP